MLRRTVSSALAILVVAAAISAVPVQTAGGSEDPPGTNSGPPYTYTTELVGQFGFLPLRNKGQLTRTDHGYRFRTGNQRDHIVVSRVDGKLRFVDTGNVDSWRKLSPACHRQRVRVGIAAICPVPSTITVRRPLLIELWPRGGDDFTDTSTLPATFATTVLSDFGDDVSHFGAGPDFFNGFLGRDKVWAGAGNDWIRTGDAHDVVVGGPGNDDIAAADGPETGLVAATVTTGSGVGPETIGCLAMPAQTWSRAAKAPTTPRSTAETAATKTASRSTSPDPISPGWRCLPGEPCRRLTSQAKSAR